MDSSYGNSGQNASGAPGVNLGVVASGSNVDPGMGVNNPSMSGVQIPQPMGDIILSGNEPKRSNKGLLFIIAALVGVVLIVGIVIMILVGRGGGGTTVSDGSDYGNFLKYANYLLDGTENSKDDIGDFDKSREYALDKAYVEDNSSFFTKAQELWGVFYEKIQADGKYSETSKMIGDAEYQNELMDFATKYMLTKNLVEDDDLIRLYIDNGVDGAKAQVDKNYETLLGTIFESGKKYAEASVDYAKKVIDVYSIYDSYGCIKNGEIDDTCSKENDEKIVLASAEYMTELPDVDDTIIVDVLDDLVNFCFRIKNDFGETDG